jgi:protein O-mannosyl-transferase
MSLTAQTAGRRETSQFSGLFGSVPKRVMLLSLLLLAITLFVYQPVKSLQFINYDDNAYVTENTHVLSGLTWNNLLWAFTSEEAANWHPLTWLSHMLDCTLFGFNPAAHHLINLLWHAINAVLVFLLLQRGTGSMGRSFFVATLFAVHPLNVESVAWVSERKNILCTSFWLLTIGAYGWYVLKPTCKRYLSVVGLFVLAIMSKPMVVTLPFVLLLLDYWPLRRINIFEKGTGAVASISRLVLEKLPLALLVAFSCAVTLKAQNSVGAMDVLQLPLKFRIENALTSYLAYIDKMFWPAHLAIFYPHPQRSIPAWQIALAILFLTLTTIFVLRMREKRYLLVGWLWYLGTLVPVLGIVQVGSLAMADRYAYIPLMGIFLMTAWLLADWMENFAVFQRNIVLTIAASTLVALSVDTGRELTYWHDSETLWSRSIEVTGNNMEANLNYGKALLSVNKPAEAIIQYKLALADNPPVAAAHYNMTIPLLKLGMAEEAIHQSDAALALMADTAVKALPYNSRGLAFSQLGRNAEAERDFKEAIRLAPSADKPHINYGLLLQREGRFKEAVFQFAAAVKLAPSNLGYLYLGQALRQANRPREALGAYQQALQITPGITEAQNAIDSIQQSLAQQQDAQDRKKY